MELIKRETIKFSKEELRCVEMTYMLMENLGNCASNPNIIKHADNIVHHLNEIFYCVEEEE